MTGPLSRLSPKEVLALAIHIERTNQSRLRQYAQAFAAYDDSVAGKFLELAEEEALHESWLTKKYRKMFKGRIPTPQEMQLGEMTEAAEWNEAEYGVFDSLKADGVFRLALDAENSARNFYQTAVRRVKNPALVKIFRELAGMENDHVGWLKKRIRRLS